MNQRQVDLALLAGIGVLLVAILVLALSAAPMRGGGADNPPNAEAQANQPAQENQGEPATQDAETAQIEPSEEANNEDAGAEEVTAVDVTSEEANADERIAEEGAQTDTESADENAAQAGEGTDAEPAAEESTEASDAQTDAAPAEEGQAPPAGAVNLNRVGFAFITAETGACSIPLQPWRQVAVSRDLLAEYGCGATITVDLADSVNGNQQVTAQIADTMNPSFERTVNIFVAEEEPALEYGITTGTIESTSP